jgi:ketosteroid isomerase-like protein
VTAEVLAANDAFYAAFAGRDYEAMEQLWAHQAPVACIHPGWNVLHGRSRVMASWKSIFESGGAPPIQPSNATAHVVGDSAFVVCLENVPGATLIATNVFVREEGMWMMVHHHAAPVARMRPATLDEPEEEDGDDEDDDAPGGSGGMLN